MDSVRAVKSLGGLVQVWFGLFGLTGLIVFTLLGGI